MPSQILRDYQQRGISEILAAYKAGARSVLAVAPTGSGKTTVFSHVLAELDARRQRGVILVHRRELATQACNRLREFGVRFGLILAGELADPTARIQVASVQTLVRRRAPPAQLVVADEAHLSTAATWRNILANYPQARILGVTATPWRLSGKPLAGQYDRCVVIATPRELREQGHLCGYNGFSYLTPDLSDVSTTAGDYNEEQTAKAMSQFSIVDNVVEEWGAHARELSTVVFAVTKEHSRQLAARFVVAGVRAEHLDGDTPLEQRQAILARVERGQTRVLCNVGVAVEGLDIPRLKCCVLARPTKSLARAIQMMGRVRRPYAECPCGHGFVPKLHALACPKCSGRSWRWVEARIHDHAFVLGQHGLPDDDRDYTLTAKPEKPPDLRTCKECRALYSGNRCTACSAEVTPEITERVLATVGPEGLERREFSSGDAPAVPAPPPVRNPNPVKIDWATVKIGRDFDGVFLGSSEEVTSFRGRPGKRKRYLVRCEERDYSLPGTATLDLLMRRAIVGRRVRIEYLGQNEYGNSPHRFSFGFDDGTPEPAHG
jgi:DNA repair protein RadD